MKNKNVKNMINNLYQSIQVRESTNFALRYDLGGFEGRDVGRDANEADARGAPLTDILAQYIK